MVQGGPERGNPRFASTLLEKEEGLAQILLFLAHMGLFHRLGVVASRLANIDRSSESLFPIFEHTTEVLHCLDDPFHTPDGLFVILRQHADP